MCLKIKKDQFENRNEYPFFAFLATSEELVACCEEQAPASQRNNHKLQQQEI